MTPKRNAVVWPAISTWWLAIGIWWIVAAWRGYLGYDGAVAGAVFGIAALALANARRQHREVTTESDRRPPWTGPPLTFAVAPVVARAERGETTITTKAEG